MCNYVSLIVDDYGITVVEMYFINNVVGVW